MRSLFLDSGIFFECLDDDNCKTLLNHAINKGFALYTSITVIGETILIMLKKGKDAEYSNRFFQELTRWDITILVPDNSVPFICYEFSQDISDGRFISQVTDRTHLAYAMAYTMELFLSSDTALKNYRVPAILSESGYTKPQVLSLSEFKEDYLSKGK
ncbi:MAG: PIN domain-containing protein [Methanoregula sp.]|nr:PIN domain-containing protein [Methanoregula sp.]